jgi:hypothetical protein
MKVIFVGAAITGLLIAIVVIVIQLGAKDDVSDGVVESAAASEVDLPAGAGVGAEPQFLGIDPGSGVIMKGPDPAVLKEQLEAAGVEVPDDLTTMELLQLAMENGAQAVLVSP